MLPNSIQWTSCAPNAHGITLLTCRLSRLIAQISPTSRCTGLQNGQGGRVHQLRHVQSSSWIKKELDHFRQRHLHKQPPSLCQKREDGEQTVWTLWKLTPSNSWRSKWQFDKGHHAKCRFAGYQGSQNPGPLKDSSLNSAHQHTSSIIVRGPPSNAANADNIWYDEEPYKLGSFFSVLISCVLIPIDIHANTLRTVGHLWETRAGLNRSSRFSLHRLLNDHIKVADPPRLWIPTKRADYPELDVVLTRSCWNQVLLSSQTMSSIFPKVSVPNANWTQAGKSDDVNHDVEQMEFRLFKWLVRSRYPLPRRCKKSQVSGKTAPGHRDQPQYHRTTMLETTKRIMYILPGVHLYIHTVAISANEVSLPNVMVIASAIKSTTCIAQSQSDEPDGTDKNQLYSSAPVDAGGVDSNKMTYTMKKGSPNPRKAEILTTSQIMYTANLQKRWTTY